MILYRLKIIMLVTCTACAVWVGSTVAWQIDPEQQAAIYTFVAAAFLLGLFFGMDEDD